MARLTWDRPSERTYYSGVDRGVLFVEGSSGVVWNGLVSVSEHGVSRSSWVIYYDGYVYHRYAKQDSYEATIEAYTYPDQLDTAIDKLGLAYRVFIDSTNYQLHLVYNATLTVPDISRPTLDASRTIETMQWDLSTVPISAPQMAPTAHLYFDTRYTPPEVIARVEELLYGTATTSSMLPSPKMLLDIVEEFAILRIIDHGDGTWTALGPDEAIQMLDSSTFQITWPSAIFLDSETYEISSL